MSQLKLLDLDIPSEGAKNNRVETSEGTGDIPVHLFLSPEHSVSSGRASISSSNEPKNHGRLLRETTFVTVEKHHHDEPGSDKEELVTPESISPLTISSSRDEITSPIRNLARRTNKIQDVDRGLASRVVIREDCDRRRSGDDSVREFEGSRSITSMSDHVSDHLSYKDRLRDHINSVRERAAESISRPQSRSQSRTHSRMKMLLTNRPTRSEDVLKREEREVSAALEKHQKLRRQWSHLSDELLRRKAEKDGYEFFTHEADCEGGVEPPPNVEPGSPSLTEKSNDGKMTAADCLNLHTDYEPVTWLPAKLAPDTSHRFKELIFYPPSKAVPFEEKVEDGLNPRFVEDEGLYVEEKENRPRRMKTRLEHRLLKVPGGKKWFGSDGELLSKPSKFEFSLEIHEATKKGTFYQFPTLSTVQQNMDDTLLVLDVELLAIRFSHHSLFSREHILAQRLRDLWRRFRQLRLTDSCRRLKGQLDALRRARDTAKEEDFERLDGDISEITKRWFSASHSEKQVESRLLATWRDLQRLREEQGYRSTSIQLIVKQRPGRDIELWEKEIELEIAQAKNEAFCRYKKLSSIYDQELEKWSRHMPSAEEQVVCSEEVAVSVDPPTPVPPLNVAAIEQEVREKFRTCFRNPSDPEMELSLGDLGPPTPATDAREGARRVAVKKQEIFVKLSCNGREVYKSESQPLSFGFTVKFGQRFAVRLLEWPQTLSLQLVENGRQPCDVYLPFPDRLTTVETAEVGAHEFSSAAIVNHTHAGVGCGRDIVPCPGGSGYNSRPVCLFTSGTLTCRLGWAVGASGHVLAPPSHFRNFVREKDGRESTVRTHAEVSKLREWVEKARLDPNDPGNAQLFQTLDQAGPTTLDAATPHLNLDFCEEEEIINNPRFRLLRLRDQGEPEFRGYEMVPLCEKLINPDIFKAYEARMLRPLEQETLVDPLDSHRALGRRSMLQIRQAVLQRCRQARQHRRLVDIVAEDQVPDFGTLGLTLMRWLRPKRPLRPERKQRKKVPVQHLIGQGVSIIVNVVRAFEVPVRKDMDSMSINESIDGFSIVNVRPFVSVTFRGESARTTAAEGANPTWNQDLVLPVRSSTGDFSPGALAGMKDTLFLHLFDEVVVDLVEEDGLRDTTIHHRLEKHWLAGLEIPFSTLYCNSRVEGTFQLYSPPVLLGYEREAHRITGGVLPQRDATYLTLFITLQPALNPPEPFLDVFETTETPALEAHLRGWQAEVASLFPGRKIRPLVSTVAATAVCITRFIRPIQPPTLASLAEVPTTPAAAARFVSRIPTMASATFYPGLLNVWLTCDIVGMLSGDVEDHAVLLTCFLLHMGHPAYLLLGVGIPHGASAYVLINSPGAEVIWDPTTGCKYSIRDSFCPLQKVCCLVSNTNIWANIQEEDSPRRTRFDVSKRADWLPAFNKNYPAPTDSIQPETLEYKETSKQAVQALQDKLESRMRDGMMKWRRRQRTQWNRYCAATMRKLLPRLEEATWDLGEPTSPDHWQGLQHILASHKVCGFPVNTAYTDMDAVMEAVKATGVHSNESEEVEFALAVYIYPYPCDVLSVWVYVASLTRRR